MKNLFNYVQQSFGLFIDKMEVLSDKIAANINIATNNLEVEEFKVKSDEFVIPGEIISHKDSKAEIPTMFWCHGGPHDNSERTLLTKIAKHLNVNVVGFDFRGSKILEGYYKNIRAADYSTSSTFYNDVDKDYGGGHMRDLYAVVEYITNKTTFDSNKFIIGGHSFGGYMVAMALTDANMSSTFKLGIAASGFYDLGTFKFINCSVSKDTPKETEETLRKQSPMSYAHKINNDQKIIIMHGGEQDKTTLVSRQGAEEFINSLHNHDKKVISYFNDSANHTDLDFVESFKEICLLEHQTLEGLMGLDSSLN